MREERKGAAKVVPLTGDIDMVKVVLLLILAFAASCTVRPLYSDGPAFIGGEAGGAVQEMASIAISEPETRVGQEVRNHLIFMFGRGQGQPTSPRYSMTLTVAATVLAVARRPAAAAGEDRPSAGSLRLIGSYFLTDVTTGDKVAEGTREISASFDRPRQEFASARAERDAENRAARELAELIRLDIGAKITQRGYAPG